MLNYKAIASSKKTTALGAVSLLIALLMALQDYLGTGGVDIAKYLTPENITVLLGVITGLIGLFSRDADKSSQDSKIRDPLPAENVAAETEALISDTFNGNTN